MIYFLPLVEILIFLPLSTSFCRSIGKFPSFSILEPLEPFVHLGDVHGSQDGSCTRTIFKWSMYREWGWLKKLLYDEYWYECSLFVINFFLSFFPTEVEMKALRVEWFVLGWHSTVSFYLTFPPTFSFCRWLLHLPYPIQIPHIVGIESLNAFNSRELLRVN